ncbi:MAG: DoxX family protein [Sphingomonadales bacterium]|nr:DoxX family protein [Sphingomonadales bacterium]
MPVDFEDEPRLPDSGRVTLRREGEGGQERADRRFVRQVLVIFYALAGSLHLLWPQPFLSIVPGWVPLPALVVALTGLAELAGAVGLAQSRRPALRRAAGWGLALYALCVWPANWHHMMLDLAAGHAGRLFYHVPRLAAQPVLIWAAPWAAGARWRRR